MKGVSLELMVGLIIAIIAAAVIILIVFTSGLITNFKETVGVFIIMISAYMRIIIIALLNMLMIYAAIVLLVILIVNRKFSWVGGLSGLGIEHSLLSGKGLSIGSPLAYALEIIFLISTAIALSYIPFFGSTINVYLGDQKRPYNYTLVADEIANRIDTTWKVMGANGGNPLEGLTSEPNPYPVFVIFPYPNQTLNMSYVYSRLTKKFGVPDYDIYVFCDNSKGIVGKKPWTSNFNPVCWFSKGCEPLKYKNGRMYYNGTCNITNKSEIFVEYGDVITGLGPGFFPGIRKDNNCPYMTGVGDLDRDVIAICIKERS